MVSTCGGGSGGCMQEGYTMWRGGGHLLGGMVQKGRGGEANIEVQLLVQKLLCANVSSYSN